MDVVIQVDVVDLKVSIVLLGCPTKQLSREDFRYRFTGGEPSHELYWTTCR